MNDKIQSMASNYLYVIPFALIIATIWFKLEKHNMKHPSKNTIMGNTFFYRFLAFVGVLTFIIVYANKPISLDDSIVVAPADF
jgi:hypothetical protein